jgi:hypothetical protein
MLEIVYLTVPTMTMQDRIDASEPTIPTKVDISPLPVKLISRTASSVGTPTHKKIPTKLKNLSMRLTVVNDPG